MILSAIVTNDKSESLELQLRSPEQSGFFVRKIDGLGPVKATINTTQSLSVDGSRFNSARLEARNIVLDLGFLYSPTIEDVRQKSYKYFPLKSQVSLQIVTDKKTTKTVGYVESNDPNIFSNDEGCQVSIICPDPYLYALSKQIVEFSSVTSEFSFPFANESLTQKLLIFGNLTYDNQKSIFYEGEASTGMDLYIHATGPVGTFTLYNLLTRESMTIDSTILAALTGSGIVSGDDIVINTQRGSKKVTLIRAGESINILNALGEDSTWLTLNKGENVFYYTATSGVSNLTFRIEYWPIYEGI